MAEKYKNKFDKLANAPIKGLISSLAVPTILSMLVSAFYNMADSFFVGKINTQSVASIGIVFSIMTLLQAIGFFLGNGSGIMISTLLGEKNKKKAEIYANVALFTVIGVGVLLAVIGLFFSKSIALMLGATKTTAHYASTYLKYILLGSPFILGSFVLNNQLRYQGSALYSMIGILTGSIINIALDPLFIFTFKLEVAGAALATAVSQIISFFISKSIDIYAKMTYTISGGVAYEYYCSNSKYHFYFAVQSWTCRKNFSGCQKQRCKSCYEKQCTGMCTSFSG